MVLSLAEERRDVARSRIVQAAGMVLADRGLAATIDDVADVAGVNRRTIFRHFVTRDGLFVAAIRAGIRRYGEQLPEPPESGDGRAWLREVLTVAHRLNARNGRVFWELVGVRPAGLSEELVAVAAECRESRRRFAATVSARVWGLRGGRGAPPEWLVDAVAVHLSGFTTQSLSGDFDRSPEEVADVSARVLESVFAAAHRK